MSIRLKLYISFGIVLFVAVAMFAFSFISIRNFRNNFNETVAVQLELERLANDIRYYDVVLTDNVRNYLIDPQNEVTYANYFENADALDAALAAAQELSTSEETRQIFANIDVLNVDLIEIEEQLLADPDLEQAVELYRGTYGDLKVGYAENVTRFFDLQRIELNNQVDTIFAQINQVIVVSLVLLVVMLVVSFAAILTLTRNISDPMIKLTSVAGDIARGDFSRRAVVTAQDEIGVLGAAFNTMASEIEQAIVSVETRSGYLATTVEVGSLVTRINTQEELLPAATEFIRSRFGLYYTQIYLLDETGRYALLSAGTGDVGQQLLARQHRLDTDGRSLVATAVQSRQSVLVANTESSDIHSPNALLPDTRSEIAIPLLVGDEVIGVLDLQADEADTFNEDNSPVFESMASQVASALYGARAYSEVQVAIDRAEQLNERITSENWRGYLGSLGDGAKVQYEFDAFGSDNLRLLDDNISLHDIAQDMQENYSLNAAVKLGGQNIGRIVVREENEREWTEEERTLIEDAADRLGQAAEQFRAFDEVDKSAAETNAINQILSITREDSELAAMLESVSTVLLGFLQPDNVVVSLYNNTTNEWQGLVGVGGEMTSEIARTFNDPGEAYPHGMEAIDTKQPVAVDKTTEYPNFPQEYIEILGLKSVMVIPMVVNNMPVGTIFINYSSGFHSFTSDDMQFADSVRSQLSLSMERRNAVEETERRALEMETVAQVSAAATSTLDRDELLKSVADLTKVQFDLYHTHVYLLDEDGQNLILAAGAGSAGDTMVEREHQIILSHPRSLVASAARSGEGVIVDDVTLAEDYLPNPLLPDTRSELAVPMIVGDEVIGVMDAQAIEIARFDESEVQVFTALASQVAVAVENARAFEREQETVERLREVDQLKSQFLANMSHELRTPLNSIIGYAGILVDGAEGELPEEAVEDIDIIHQSGKHLLSIINDILDLAKIEARELKLRYVPTDMSQILEEVVRSGQILATEKNITLKVIKDADILPVKVDVVRMRQITWNLTSNAMKFTEKGGVTVRYGMLNEEEIYIRIEDTGMGIPEEHLGQVFERFRQVDESSTRSAGGTGLGLTITRELIQMHGGDIYAESEVGVGSTFWFKLPIAVAEAEETSEVSSQPAS